MSEGTAGSRAGVRPGIRTKRSVRRPRILRLVAWLCLLAGAALVISTGVGIGVAGLHEYQTNQKWQQIIEKTPPPSVAAEPPPASMLHPVDGIDFSIRVPAANYYSAVEEGVSLNILYIGPGHYPVTRWPGQVGTVGVAAHNTYWLQFANVKRGDLVIIQTRYGTFKYRITGTAIVAPTDVQVLDPTAHARRLVLTTCWPLWAGAFATKRLIFFGQEVSPNYPLPRL